MTDRRPTLQSLDPLGALGGRPLTVLAGFLAAGIVLVLTLSHLDQIANPPFAVAAILTACLSCAVLALVTSPSRMPVRLSGTLLVVGIGGLAAVLYAIAGWGANTLIRDDWGSILLGLLLVALSPYRPPVELLLTAVGCAALLAVLTVIQLPYFGAGLSAPVIVTIAVVPVLAMALGGAAFSSAVLAYLSRWRRNARKAAEEEAEAMHEGIVRAVQQGRVLLLNQEVVPLFTSLVERGTIEEEDIEQARSVAVAIRDIMAVETQRSWLDDALTEPGSAPDPARSPSSVDDRSRLLDRMDFEQRAALRAFVVALRERTRAAASDVLIRVSGEAPEGEVLVSAGLRAPDADKILAPYVAVLRAVFRRVNVGYSPAHVTVRFNYDVE